MDKPDNQKESINQSNSRLSSKTIDSDKKSKKQIVIQLVKEWYHNFQEQKKDYHICYQTFIHHYSKAMKMKIRFDNSISNLLVDISKQMEFLQFTDQKQNQLKITLEFINQILKEKNFISQRQYNKFKNQFLSNNLQDSIYLLQNNLKDQGYVKRQNQTAPLKKVSKAISEQQKSILLKIWNISMMPSLETCWKYILKQKIQHKFIFIIFHIYEYILQEQTSRQFRKDITFYLRDLLERKKQAKIIPIHIQEASIVQYDHILDLKAEQISAYLNKQRWMKYQQQYQILTKFLLKRSNKKQLKFQPYGSFQSKFYVIKYSDIDIGLYYESIQLHQREKLCNLLTKICDAINADKNHLPNCLYAKIYKDDKIKIPFVKIIYNNSYGKNKDIVPTMDIIVNNYQGIQNSKMLALYSEDEYILKFCNLIKYWAVKRSLINMYKKIQGLSSYGVLLMCLYYLMVTKQIPYLKKVNKEYDVGKDKFNISYNLLDNFIGFLKFYSYEYKDSKTTERIRGQFHKQQRIACLLQNHDGKKVYDDSLIINMYDFIDGSNPGRMKTYLYDKFKTIFQTTLDCLEQRSLSFLSVIYNQDDSLNSKDNKFPRRGNRFFN